MSAEFGFLEVMAASALGILRGLAQKLPYIVMAGIFLLLTWWVANIVGRIVRGALARTSTEGHVDVFVGKFASACVFVVGVIVVLGTLGVQVAALITTLGLAGLTIGFALKDVLANSMSGVLLLVQRPFTLGDRIAVAGCEGTVRDIRVRDTLIEQADGRMVYVPNATVFNAPIVNTSSAQKRRIDVQVHVPLTADLDSAKAAVAGALASTPGLVAEAPVEAVYVRMGVASATLSGRAWVDTATTPYAKAFDAAIRATNKALRTQGIEPASAE